MVARFSLNKKTIVPWKSVEVLSINGGKLKKKLAFPDSHFRKLGFPRLSRWYSIAYQMRSSWICVLTFLAASWMTERNSSQSKEFRCTFFGFLYFLKMPSRKKKVPLLDFPDSQFRKLGFPRFSRWNSIAYQMRSSGICVLAFLAASWMTERNSSQSKEFRCTFCGFLYFLKMTSRKKKVVFMFPNWLSADIDRFRLHSFVDSSLLVPGGQS